MRKVGAISIRYCPVVCILLMAPVRLRGVEPVTDTVACCNEARAFLRSIGLQPKASSTLALEPGKKFLFVDDRVLGDLNGVTSVLHPPKKYGAVLHADRPWEGTIQTRTAPSWNPEKKIWMLWYFGAGGTAYATSKDGINWEKPVLGVHSYKGSSENNLLPIGLSYVIYDPKDPDANRRYKGFTGEGPHHGGGPGFYPAVSADGIRWKLLTESYVYSQDEANLFHDEDRNLFIFTVKQPGPYGRSVYLTLSRDFVHWTDPRDCLIFHADHHDQELGVKWIKERFADPTMQHPEYNIPAEYSVQVYNMGVFRYGDLYFGLPAMFHQTGKVPKDWDGFSKYKLSPEVLQAVHSYGDWTGFHHLQLIASRDLINWWHVGDRKPFLDASPLGTGAYDLQVLMPAPPPVRRGDELWFYYTGIKRYAYVTSGEPDLGGICLAKLRLDRFLSLDADNKGGTVVTQPMTIEGGTLHVNLETRDGGDVRAEILDPVSRRPLSGYTLSDSVPATGDSLDSDLLWRSAKLAALKGKACRLRFTLRNASLYAFWTAP